jgi:hypothetical protein
MFELRRGLPKMRSRGETKPHADAEPDPDEWLGVGALTDADKALIEQRFRGLEANPHASVPWEEAKLPLMGPFKRRAAGWTSGRKQWRTGSDSCQEV